MDLKLLRVYLAELVGTFFVVFVGAGTVCAGYVQGGFGVSGGTRLIAALAEGFALAVALSFTFYLSQGCLNPAITLALWVLKRLDGGRVALLITVQVLGAFLAGLALRGLFKEPDLIKARLGTPHLTEALLPGENVVTFGGLAVGALLEFLFTSLVMLAVFATLFDRRAPRLGGMLVGMAQVAVILCGYGLTGGCANPARWFGPAVWQLSLPYGNTVRPLADHLVYWVGPILGALAGGIFYSLVVLPPEKK
jgi:MIP family channel proteins